MNIKEQIRAEIERRIRSIESCPFIEAEVCAYDKRNGKLMAYRDVLSFLDTLPEQPVLPGIEEEGIPGRDFIPVDWVDACERYGKWKIVQKVQLASEGLEEEIHRYWKEEMPVVTESDLNDIARHFYDLGCRRTAEKYDEIEYNRQRAEEAELSEDLEEEISRYLREECSGNDEPSVSEIARHFAEFGKNNLK